MISWRCVWLGVSLTFAGFASSTGAEPGKAREVIESSCGIKLVLIPAGTFAMGSPENEVGRFPNEGVPVEVTITRPFYLGTTEVTQGQWKCVMGTEPWKGRKEVKEGANYPATYVSWEDATAFCKKLAGNEGKPYRLPTEAEWEYACRAGTATAFSFGRNASQLEDYGWFDKNAHAVGEKYAHYVGQKKANAWGLYDMHGNLSEWCQDVYLEKLPGGRDPLVTSGGSERVSRGGTWCCVAFGCRSANRDAIDPSFPFEPLGGEGELGFRVALNLLTK